MRKKLRVKAELTFLVNHYYCICTGIPCKES